jgi:large conductance mechanosensitive channel
MLRDFKTFLITQNVLALALAVVIGAATNELVQALVADFIMPIVGAVTPGDDWRTMTVGIGSVRFLVGHFLGALLSFVIVAFVAWQISRALIKPPVEEKKPATRPCPFCRQPLDAAATRCAFCTSQLTAVT